MSSPTIHTSQSACVTDSDGASNAVPVSFVGYAAGHQAGPTSSFSFVNKGIHYAAPAPEAKQSTPWVRRIIGVALVVLGIPLLILPGPGIFCIGFGLFLALKR